MIALADVYARAAEKLGTASIGMSARAIEALISSLVDEVNADLETFKMQIVEVMAREIEIQVASQLTTALDAPIPHRPTLPDTYPEGIEL